MSMGGRMISLGSDWRETAVFMIDFEGSPRTGVVEFGVVHLQGGAIVGATTAACQPRAEISRRESAVHGLTHSRLQRLQPFADYFDQFVAFRRAGLFAAHNRHAEDTFIRDQWPVPPPVPDPLQPAATCNQWGPWLDTLSIYRAIYPGLGQYGLNDLIQRFELQEALAEQAQRFCPPDRQKPHCALFDALGSALLLLRLEDEPTLAGKISLAWLLAFNQSHEQQTELF